MLCSVCNSAFAAIGNKPLSHLTFHISVTSSIVVGADWLSEQKAEGLVAAPCSTDTDLGCMWLHLQCTGGQVT